MTKLDLFNPFTQLLQISDTRFVDSLKEAKYWTIKDVHYMQQAINLAKLGAQSGEVPVGAVLVCGNRVIGEGYNQPILSQDPTAHAEVVALRCACLSVKNYRLPVDSTLYVTLEPCTMCVGALIHARLSRVVFATHEPRAGMVGSRMDLTKQEWYNHAITTNAGLLRSDSQKLLKDFFKSRRSK